MGKYDLFRKIAQSTLTESEREIELMQYDMILSFEDSPSFEKVYINDSVTTNDVWITDNSSNPNNKVDYLRKIIMKPESIIYGGDVVTRGSDKWLVLSSQMYGSIYSYGFMQKCNNILKWKDSNGVTLSAPCIFEGGKISSDFDYNKDIILLDGQKGVTVAYNSYTNTIQENDRFLFDGSAYKVVNINKHNRTSYADSSSVTIITFTMYKDDLAEGDDVVNNIANSTQYLYTLELGQSNFNGGISDTGNLTSSVFLNGSLVSKPVIYTSSDITKATINPTTGAYSLLALGTVTFTAAMTDNPAITDSVTVTITNTIVDTYQVRISPDVTEIYVGESQTYSAYLFKNNVQQVALMTIVGSGISTDYYTLTIVDGNHFTITNKKKCDTGKLTVTCTNGSYSENIIVSIKGAF